MIWAHWPPANWAVLFAVGCFGRGNEVMNSPYASVYLRIAQVGLGLVLVKMAALGTTRCTSGIVEVCLSKLLRFALH